MSCEEILGQLRSLANLEAAKGMARYGINPRNTYGVSIPRLREIAREAGHDHALSSQAVLGRLQG
ncbi:MAG: DNA alkylation repair protein [Dehalococcoidia bacterium]|nr:DNA alkylation repair protein [Dehalococcoidia bacterium]